MVSDSDFQREWKRLFAGGRAERETVRKARKLLNQLSLESPLRVRFAKDLDEIETIVRRRTNSRP